MRLVPAQPGDAAAITAVLAAAETAAYGASTFALADLEDEWRGLDVPRDVVVARDNDRVAGVGRVFERGEVFQVEGCVHPGARGRGVGRRIAEALEQAARDDGARTVHSSVLEADAAGRALLESLGYRAARRFREMRIAFDAPPPAPDWPDGFTTASFDPARDATAFHAAQEEAFADHWDHVPRDFAAWSRRFLETERFVPALWAVVRAGEEIAGGTISTPATYGGGFISAVFTRRPWRRRGVGAALVRDAFRRLYEHGERSAGLGVDTAGDTGALRLYERAGMRSVLGWIVYAKMLERVARPPAA